MPKKFTYIAKLDTGNPQHSGVWMKSFGIQRAFESFGFVTEIVLFKNSTIHLNDNEKDIHFFWIRHSIYGFRLINVLNKIQNTNPNAKVIYEIPTYPLYKEYPFIKRILAWFYMNIILRFCKTKINNIVTCSLKNTISNIPVIFFANGIDANQYTIWDNRDSNQPINLIAIGSLWNWFGLVRLIKSWKNISNVKLHIFGDGKEKAKISKLIIDRNLQNDIILYGYKDREELNKINFMNAIGVGTLGDYRNVFLQRPSLKHREYCGRGIPFFYAGDDPDFHQDRCPFIYKVPLNNDLLDINEIIHWYRTLTITQEEIREYALKHLDWKIKIKQILDRIEM